MTAKQFEFDSLPPISNNDNRSANNKNSKKRALESITPRQPPQPQSAVAQHVVQIRRRRLLSVTIRRQRCMNSGAATSSRTVRLCCAHHRVASPTMLYSHNALYRHPFCLKHNRCRLASSSFSSPATRTMLSRCSRLLAACAR